MFATNNPKNMISAAFFPPLTTAANIMQMDPKTVSCDSIEQGCTLLKTHKFSIFFI